MASPSQGKPDIVRRRHRSAQRMLVHEVKGETLLGAIEPDKMARKLAHVHFW